MSKHIKITPHNQHKTIYDANDLIIVKPDNENGFTYLYSPSSDQIHKSTESAIREAAKLYPDPISPKNSLYASFERRIATVMKVPYADRFFHITDADGHRGKLIMNTFLHPSCHYGTPPAQEIHLPKIYDDFFKHLVANDEQRTYMVDWMAHSLKSRNYVFLVMQSYAQGVGKGVLDKIITAIHLAENKALMESKDIVSRFLSLEGKTYAFLDEFESTEKQLESCIKTLINSEIRCEKKGQDQKIITNYASIMIACNKTEGLKIRDGDRRFAFLDLNNIKYEASQQIADSKMNMNDFINNVLLSNENLKQLYYHLYNRKITSNLFAPPMSETRERFINDSKEEWKWVIDDLITTRHETEGEKYQRNPKNTTKCKTKNIPYFIVSVNDIKTKVAEEADHKIGKAKIFDYLLNESTFKKYIICDRAGVGKVKFYIDTKLYVPAFTEQTQSTEIDIDDLFSK